MNMNLSRRRYRAAAPVGWIAASIMCAAAEAADSRSAHMPIGEVLAGAASDFAAGRWRARLGENSRIVTRLVHGPSGFLSAGGARGDLDVTRWSDGYGRFRHDLRHGLVRRFAIGEPGDGVVGVAALVQRNLEYGHERAVAGVDYAGVWGRGSLHVFVPTSGGGPRWTDWSMRRRSPAETSTCA